MLGRIILASHFFAAEYHISRNNNMRSQIENSMSRAKCLAQAINKSRRASTCRRIICLVADQSVISIRNIQCTAAKFCTEFAIANQTNDKPKKRGLAGQRTQIQSHTTGFALLSCFMGTMHGHVGQESLIKATVRKCRRHLFRDKTSQRSQLATCESGRQPPFKLIIADQ